MSVSVNGSNHVQGETKEQQQSPAVCRGGEQLATTLSAGIWLASAVCNLHCSMECSKVHSSRIHCGFTTLCSGAGSHVHQSPT